MGAPTPWAACGVLYLEPCLGILLELLLSGDGLQRPTVECDHFTPLTPDAVQTLYLSKNSLRNLDGIQQFTSLKALSVADNQLGDLAVLGALRSAGIALEAANFEGNPIADLPNYRAHVLEQLGHSVQVAATVWRIFKDRSS